MDLTPARLQKLLRYDSDPHWEFGYEIRKDGDWATFCVPIHDDQPPGEVMHTLALVAAAVVARGLVNDSTQVQSWDWNDLLKGPE